MRSLISLLLVFLIFAIGQNDPDPSRFREEIEAFADWDAKNTPADDGILFVGSSSIRLWATAQAFPDLPVINRGFGGAHISDILFYYDQVVKPYNPRLIVFYCGDNDIADKKKAERVYADYVAFVQNVRQDLPGVRIIFISIKPSSSRWSFWPEMSRANDLVRELAESEDDLLYVDLATPLLTPEGKPDDSLFLGDKLHLNKKGYDKWRLVLGKILAKFFR